MPKLLKEMVLTWTRGTQGEIIVNGDGILRPPTQLDLPSRTAVPPVLQNNEPGTTYSAAIASSL